MLTIETINRIVRIRMTGSISLLDLKNAIAGIIDQPDHIPGLDEIWDFTEADFAQIDANAIQLLSIYVAGLLEQDRLKGIAMNVAYVTGRDLEYGVMRMWEAYASESAPQNRYVTNDMDDAHQWIMARQ